MKRAVITGYGVVSCLGNDKMTVEMHFTMVTQGLDIEKTSNKWVSNVTLVELLT